MEGFLKLVPAIAVATVVAAVVSAVVAGIFSRWVAGRNARSAKEVRNSQTRAEHELLGRKISSDHELALQRIKAEHEARLNDRAWTDYEVRRDAYLELIDLAEGLMEGGDQGRRAGFVNRARKIRLVASDEVVLALNALTQGIASHTGGHDARFSELMAAMRRDIRSPRATPPDGTTLDLSAFPIEK